MHSAAGLPLPPGGLVRRPPFRAPHHGASAVSLIGGGTMGMRPGEISAAHNGVLFLDELAEFPPAVLDTLRQPLEEGVVRVSRAWASATFPARFLLVAAMNPCPCGEGLALGRCRCSERSRLRYAGRVSGPLLDRFDLRVQVDRPEIDQLLGGHTPGCDDRGVDHPESSTSVARRVRGGPCAGRRAWSAAQFRARRAPAGRPGAGHGGGPRRPRGAPSSRPAERTGAPPGPPGRPHPRRPRRSPRPGRRGGRVWRARCCAASRSPPRSGHERALAGAWAGVRAHRRWARSRRPPPDAAALAALPGMGPAALVALLRQSDPVSAWRQVLAGVERELCEVPGGARGAGGRPWAEVARAVDVAGRWRELNAAGIGVTYLGRPDYPPQLQGDPHPPGVVFWRGDLGVLDRVCVAIVGTRRCTGYGRGVARELGRDLASAGLCVVSGLALGIDGAAHAGALEALGSTTVGVAASGVDVPYPRRHARLWAEVVSRGAVLSESNPGQPAQAWRFPSRNRIIAGLSRAVVVVESHAQGGSMHTVDAAAERGIEILAVPGPVTSPASTGTNQLLRDGCAPVRHARDVLDQLGDFRAWAGGEAPSPSAAPPAVRLDPQSRRVLMSVDWTPTAMSVIAARARLPLGPLSTALVKLEGLGVVRGEGGWWERCRCR